MAVKLDHSFENLGPDRFQQLAQALLVAANPRTVCFPIGQPDGGRDAILPASIEAGRDEFIVYQVKYSRDPATVESTSEWLLTKAAGEAAKIERLKFLGAKEYFLITNVAGTAHLGSGAIDKTLAALKASFGIPIHCWFRDDLNRVLDGQWDIKLRYPEVLSGHDFFRILLESAPREDHQRRLNALRAFLADQYEEDVQVKFKQVELQNKLLDLFIDLPFRVTLRARDKTAIYHGLDSEGAQFYYDGDSAILTNQNDDNDTSGTASLLLGTFGQSRLRQVVVEGAPGQGKSTLAQYVCQVHRIRLLNKAIDFQKLPVADQQSPLRIPFKVDLRDLAAWLAGSDPFETISVDASPVPEQRTLESFLARLVRLLSGGIQFDVNDLLQVSKLAPLLIVLDGLDEVVEIKQRSDVVAAVTKALPRIRENCPNLSVVITSRPAAFANSPGFDLLNFPHIDLLSVKRSQISLYAERWMDVRGLNAKEREEFRSILKEKMTAPHLRDLSRNPMQLTILLSLILTQGSALPDKRTNLYDDYVDLFFSRESAKSPAVRKHIVLLKDLHRYLGWMLHSSAETDRRKSSGRISAGELRIALNQYLVAEGHPTEVVEEIFGAMLERVVMIVPRIQGTYEFEVQPLREYFAARFLYDTASYSPAGKEKKGTKPDRFDAVARNFYWLNVVRFFAGCFSKGELLDLADRVKALIEDPLVGKTRHPIALAARLLADWVFEQSPRAVSQLVELLSVPNNMQRLVSPVRYQGADVVTLPPKSGGRAIFDAAFRLLESDDIPHDRRHKLAKIANAQFSDEECDHRWLNSDSYVSSPIRWLRVGRSLGSLLRVSKEVLTDKLSKLSINRDMMMVLASAGRGECATSSDRNIQLLLNVILTSPAYRPGEGPVQGPFYFLQYLMSQVAWGLQYMPAQHFEEIAGFKDVILSERELRAVDASPEIRQAYEISVECSRRFASAATAAQQLGAVEMALEECQAKWGARPSVVVNQFVCALQRRVKPSIAAFDFFSSSAATSQRLRGAKARGSNVEWWLASLKQSKNTSKSLRLLLVEAFFLFCSVDVMAACESDLSAELDEMPDEDWEVVVHVLSYLRGGVRGKAQREDVAKNTNLKLDSFRFSYLAALRDSDRYGGAVFLKFFKSDLVQMDLQFRQMEAASCAIANLLPWNETLKIIRECYAKGIAAGGLDYRVRNASSTMPRDIYTEVLNNLHLYPVAICEVAEAAATRAARKAIKPVARVARNERWFPFDGDAR